jgi:hypothetical protein
MRHRLFLGFAAGLLLSAAAGSATGQSCAIGSSTFCGTRGSHNTVGNTMVFNNGPAGQRVGNYTVMGTPSRTFLYRGSTTSTLVAPRTFSGVATSRRLGGSGPAYDSAIARLRAEILAIEARYQQQQLEKMNLTPAQEAAKNDMPPALLRALRLAQETRQGAAGVTAQ